MKDKELQELENATASAYKGAIDAFIKVINCLAAEKLYYMTRCEKLEREKDGKEV